MEPTIFYIVTIFVFSESMYALPVVNFMKPENVHAEEMTNFQAELTETLNHTNGELDEKLLCEICEGFFGLADKLITANFTFEDIRPFATKVCIKVLNARGKSGDLLCPNIIKAYGPPYWFVMTYVTLQPEQMCINLHACPPRSPQAPRRLDEYVPESTRHRVVESPLRWRSSNAGHVINWKAADDITTDAGRNEGTYVKARPEMDTKGDDTSANRDKGDGLLKIVMLSDAHIERSYKKGAATECGLFGCCLPGFSGSGSAGEWGDYHCDVPLKTVQYICDHIKNMARKPDFMLYGGDSPSHHIWEQTWSLQLSGDKFVNDYLIENFRGWKIYPVIGNHESYPNSVYYQEESMYKVLNAKLAEWWQPLFNLTEEQAETITYSGYYSVLVMPGLRILAINTDYWLLTNPYFLLNDHIPAYGEQLKFIDNVLKRARLNKEKVILAGHVPAWDDTSAAIEYGEVYTDIISRYSDIIVMQVFGHTHTNGFGVILDLETNQPVGVQHITGSLTTFHNINPSFAIYYLNRTTFKLVDYESFYFDIVKANAGKPEIKQQLSAKRDYKMADLSAQSFFNLTHRFAVDDELLTTYVKNYYSQSPFWKSCGKDCRRGMRCGTNGVTAAQRARCV